MGHESDPAAEAALLRGVIREAHAAVKDLRAAIREARQLAPGLTAEFQHAAERELRSLANDLQAESNAAAAVVNASVEAARTELARHLFDARIVYDEAADDFAVVFRGAKFNDAKPPPYPDRM